MLPTASCSLRRWIALGVVLVLLLGAAAALGVLRGRVDPVVDYVPAAGAPDAPRSLTNLRAI